MGTLSSVPIINHVLFFGLDFQQFEKLFQDSWKNGYIKSLPLLQGGTRYVIDYMTKNLTGQQAVKEYDEKGIERPFYSVSKGLGSELFFSHAEEISKTGCLYVGKRWIPAPSYYSSMLSNWNDFPERIKSRQTKQFELELKAKKEGYKSLDDYVYWTSRANEENLAKKLRNSGRPAIAQLHEYISSRDYHNLAHDALLA